MTFSGSSFGITDSSLERHLIGSAPLAKGLDAVNRQAPHRISKFDWQFLVSGVWRPPITRERRGWVDNDAESLAPDRARWYGFADSTVNSIRNQWPGRAGSISQVPSPDRPPSSPNWGSSLTLIPPSRASSGTSPSMAAGSSSRHMTMTCQASSCTRQAISRSSRASSEARLRAICRTSVPSWTIGSQRTRRRSSSTKIRSHAASFNAASARPSLGATRLPMRLGSTLGSRSVVVSTELA